MTVRITTLTELSLYLIRPEDKEERVAEVTVRSQRMSRLSLASGTSFKFLFVLERGAETPGNFSSNSFLMRG